MDFLQPVQELWSQYGGVIITGFMSVVAVVGAIVAVWAQIKPILDKLQALKEKVEETKVSDVTSELQSVTLDTQITDLKAKIENPTISDTLKQAYITQLATLETLKAKIDAGLVTASETTDKYL